MAPNKTAADHADLAEYAAKRDFARSDEPPPRVARRRSTLRFVVQKHAARQVHFDFRLELDGVLKSWAVPKGPSTQPGVRRLAVPVEDHPTGYCSFEGTIPAGEYGGGTVMVWDEGTYRYIGRNRDGAAGMREGLAAGKVQFLLEGRRLRGVWTLVRTARRQDDEASWLLIRHDTGERLSGPEAVDTTATSVLTGRTMEQIAAAS